MDLKNLLRQHQEVLELMNQISAFQTAEQVRENAFAISGLLAKLSGIIKIHLSSEDKYVYPVLSKHQDSAIRHTAEVFVLEMGELAKAFEAYKTKFLGASKIAANAQAFLSESQAVFSALQARIKKEDAGLYVFLQNN